MNLSVNDIAAILSHNNAGESSAIEGYYQILALDGLPKELYDDVKEIISDEMHHQLMLARWITKLTSVKPAAN